MSFQGLPPIPRVSNPDDYFSSIFDKKEGIPTFQEYLVERGLDISSYPDIALKIVELMLELTNYSQLAAALQQIQDRVKQAQDKNQYDSGDFDMEAELRKAPPKELESYKFMLQEQLKQIEKVLSEPNPENQSLVNSSN